MKYEIREDSGASEIIEADSIEAALEQARKWASEGSYDKLVSVTVYVHALDPDTDEPYEGWYYGDGQNATDEVAAGPEPKPEPTECGDDDEDHDWQAPLELVGGCDNNPGVFSTGGTRFDYRLVCSRCGMYKHTWSQGQQRDPGDLDHGVEYTAADERSLAWVAKQ
jgi:hypothetical protein